MINCGDVECGKVVWCCSAVNRWLCARAWFSLADVAMVGTLYSYCTLPMRSLGLVAFVTSTSSCVCICILHCVCVYVLQFDAVFVHPVLCVCRMRNVHGHTACKHSW